MEKLLPKLTSVRAFVVMTDRAHMPECAIPGLLWYEDLLAAQPERYVWPDFDEMPPPRCATPRAPPACPRACCIRTAPPCCTPSARAPWTALHVSRNETALLVVPMFHVNAWSMPYAGAMSGAKLVLPGPALDGASVYQLLRDEQVTLALGVPTVWMMLLQHASRRLKPIDELALRRVVIGGAAVPRAMVEAFERDFGAFVVHVWGMTETSPVGTVCNLLPKAPHAAAGAAPAGAGKAGPRRVRRQPQADRRRRPTPSA